MDTFRKGGREWVRLLPGEYHGMRSGAVLTTLLGSCVAACLFERRGFYYVHGRKLMQRIHQEFQPGGELHQALDGSTPFRRSEQWLSIRGRAWAIHDGILAAIGERWDGLRMVKRVGSHAGMATCPGTPY